MGILNIRQPDDFDIIIIGTEDVEQQVYDELGGYIDDGEIFYIDRVDQREELEGMFGDKTDELGDGLLVVVGSDTEGTSVTCALSAVGDSVLIHCADKVLPLPKRPGTHNSGAGQPENVVPFPTP